MAVDKFPSFSLAEFQSPPVVETVLSLQFERLAGLRTVHFGLFWEKVKERFPNTEEQPPLPPAYERFPEPLPPANQVQFETIQAPILPRVWLIDNPGREIIQIQNDRFIKNWRKSGPQDVYPHYEPVIKPAFKRDLRAFQMFLDEQKLGQMKVTQSEVTYVNHIVSGEGWHSFGDMERIFTFWRQPLSPAPNPEDIGVRVRFLLANRGDRSAAYMWRCNRPCAPPITSRCM
jgi:uncharacterized protein (TIGR04255 family)